MSQIVATVIKIDNIDNLNIVKFDFKGIELIMMSLDLNNIQLGSKVILTVKSTHIAIVKNFQGKHSDANQLKATVVSIEKGKLLSNIVLSLLDIKLESIITLDSLQKMNLHIDDEVTILINASELSILEVLS